MKDLKSFLSRNLISITIIAGFLFQTIFLFSHSIVYLIINTIPDDGFYYFQIARNIITGCGSTMDCINLTNGYHPLWMLVLLPVFKFFSVGGPADTQPIYLALFISGCFFTLSAILLSKILKVFSSNNYIISLALFVYIFNPYILYNVLNGLETGLLLFSLCLFIHRSLVYHQNPSVHNLVLWGLSGGILVLSRLDMVVVVAVSYLYILFNSLFVSAEKSPSSSLFTPLAFAGGPTSLLDWKFFSTNKAKTCVRELFYLGLGTAIFFLPWFVYNYLYFDMWFTSASKTSTFINHRLTYSDNGGYSLFLFFKTIIYMLDRAVTQFLSNTSAYLLILPFFGLFLYIKSLQRFFLHPITFIVIGNISLVFVSAGLRWTFRSWYFMPLLILTSIMLVYTLDFLAKQNFRLKILLPTLCLLFTFFFYITFEKELKDNQIMQQQMYHASLWQNQNLPAGSHIGVFNSGIQTYFSTHRVTNLDGLVNNNASSAMLNNTLWQYMTDTERLDYVSDFDSYMTYRYKDSFRNADGTLLDPTSSTTFQKVYSFPGPKDLNIYKVIYK